MDISKYVDINHTISKEMFEECDDFIKIIPKIRDWVIKIGSKLDSDEYEKIGDDIWISRDAYVDESAKIIGPCIIDKKAEIRHCAYIRGSVIVGRNCVIGNSCEIKNSIIFDNCQIPHFNYLGDSIMGYHSHMGAGVVAANIKSDRSNIVISNGNEKIDTSLRKIGSIIGDYVEIGCNSTLFPGTIIGSNVTIYPLTRVRGVILENCIVKSSSEIVRKEVR